MFEKQILTGPAQLQGKLAPQEGVAGALLLFEEVTSRCPGRAMSHGLMAGPGIPERCGYGLWQSHGHHTSW